MYMNFGKQVNTMDDASKFNSTETNELSNCALDEDLLVIELVERNRMWHLLKISRDIYV